MSRGIKDNTMDFCIYVHYSFMTTIDISSDSKEPFLGTVGTSISQQKRAFAKQNMSNRISNIWAIGCRQSTLEALHSRPQVIQKAGYRCFNTALTIPWIREAGSYLSCILYLRHGALEAVRGFWKPSPSCVLRLLFYRFFRRIIFGNFNESTEERLLNWIPSWCTGLS